MFLDGKNQRIIQFFANADDLQHVSYADVADGALLVKGGPGGECGAQTEGAVEVRLRAVGVRRQNIHIDDASSGRTHEHDNVAVVVAGFYGRQVRTLNEKQTW